MTSSERPYTPATPSTRHPRVSSHSSPTSKWKPTKTSVRGLTALNFVNRGTSLKYEPRNRKQEDKERDHPSSGRPVSPPRDVDKTLHPKAHAKALVTLLARRDIHFYAKDRAVLLEQQQVPLPSAAASPWPPPRGPPGHFRHPSLSQPRVLVPGSDSGESDAENEQPGPLTVAVRHVGAQRRSLAATPRTPGALRIRSALKSRGETPEVDDYLASSRPPTVFRFSDEVEELHAPVSNLRVHEWGFGGGAATSLTPFETPCPVRDRPSTTAARYVPRHVPNTPRAHSVVGGKFSGLALKALGNEDHDHDLPARSTDHLKALYQVSVEPETPHRDEAIALQVGERFPGARILTSNLDAATLSTPNREWMASEQTIDKNVMEAMHHLRLTRRQGRSVYKTVDSFFANMRGMKVERPFVKPPCIVGPRSFKFPAEELEADFDPDLPMDWEEILDRVSDLIPKNEQRVELKKLRKMLYKWMKLFNKMYAYYSNLWTMPGLPRGFMWQWHLRKFVKDCFLHCRNFPLAQIDRILGPVFDKSEFTLSPIGSPRKTADAIAAAGRGAKSPSRLRRRSADFSEGGSELAVADNSGGRARRASVVGAMHPENAAALVSVEPPRPWTSPDGSVKMPPKLLKRFLEEAKKKEERIAAEVEAGTWKPIGDAPPHYPTAEGEAQYEEELMLHRRDRGPIPDALYLAEALIRIAAHRTDIPRALDQVKPKRRRRPSEVEEERPSTAPEAVPSRPETPLPPRPATSGSAPGKDSAAAKKGKGKDDDGGKKGKKGKGKKKKEKKPPPEPPKPCRQQEFAPIPPLDIKALQEGVHKAWKERQAAKERKALGKASPRKGAKKGAKAGAKTPRAASPANSSRPSSPTKGKKKATKLKPPPPEPEPPPPPPLTFAERFHNLMIFHVIPNACREWDQLTKDVCSTKVQVVLEAHRDVLFQIWEHFHDGRRKYKPIMTCNGWHHFLARLDLLDDHLDVHNAHVIYENVVGEHERPLAVHPENEDTEITFEEWLDMLASAGLAKCKEGETAHRAVQRFIERGLIPACQQQIFIRVGTNQLPGENVGIDHDTLLSALGPALNIQTPRAGGAPLLDPGTIYGKTAIIRRDELGPLQSRHRRFRDLTEWRKLQAAPY